MNDDDPDYGPGEWGLLDGVVIDLTVDVPTSPLELPIGTARTVVGADRSHCEWFHWTGRVQGIVRRVLAHGQYAADLMCARHIRDDRANERGAAVGDLVALPRDGTDLEWFLEWGRKATKLDSCGCSLCRGSK